MIINFIEEKFSKDKLRICLILKDRGWILEKIAVRLAENLPNWNIDANIAYQPSPNVDINHWMWYCDGGEMYSRNTLFITHVDRPVKLLLLKERLKKADLGICMSRMTVEELVRRGIRREKLCFITPAHDGKIKPRRIVIGITSRVRTDKIKREDLLIKLAKTMRLDAFHFEIIGHGWEKIIPYLEASGATVFFYPGTNNGLEDYKINLERVPFFDYYLYLGLDDASMGVLDALAAGIPTIVSPQDFHLDLNGGMTYPFSNAAQLCGIFQELAHERQVRIDSVANQTWNEYARQHAIAWRSVMVGQGDKISDLLHKNSIFTTSLPKFTRRENLIKDLKFYLRTSCGGLYLDTNLLLERYLGKTIEETIFFRFGKYIKQLFVPNVGKST